MSSSLPPGVGLHALESCKKPRLGLVGGLMAGRTAGHAGHKGLPGDRLHQLKICRVISRLHFGPPSGGRESKYL